MTTEAEGICQAGRCKLPENVDILGWPETPFQNLAVFQHDFDRTTPPPKILVLEIWRGKTVRDVVHWEERGGAGLRARYDQWQAKEDRYAAGKTYNARCDAEAPCGCIEIQRSWERAIHQEAETHCWSIRLPERGKLS